MEQAKIILAALNHAGFKAYIVGGAVRDFLLGLTSEDIDICTAALPEEIKAVAEVSNWKTYEVGAAFGTIVVVIDDKNYEVTTFRHESYGLDSHRPEMVTFSRSIEDDLQRRDFTINALCMDIDGQIIDLFNGRQDLAAGVLRTVGSASDRFAEDGLRMFRTARFIAKLGFKLAPEIIPAIKGNLGRVQGLSVERVRDELEKILLAEHASCGLEILMKTGLLAASCMARAAGIEQSTAIMPELIHTDGMPQNTKYHKLDVWHHILSVVDNVPAMLTLRWAALLHDVAKGLPGVRGLNKRGELSDHGHDKVGADIAAKILKRLKVDQVIAKRVVWLVGNHMGLPSIEDKLLKRWLKKRSLAFKNIEQFSEAMSEWFYLVYADRIAKHVPREDDITPRKLKVEEILKSMPFYIAQLDIKGGDVAAIIGVGQQVANAQKDLLMRVQNGQLENKFPVLKQAIEHQFSRKLINHGQLGTKNVK